MARYLEHLLIVAAVTITNNNSGQNANNIQVYQSGLYVSKPSKWCWNNYATKYDDFNVAGILSI